MNLKAAYSLSEFAALLGEDVWKIRSMAKRGHLPTEKIGGKYYIPLTRICEQYPDLWESIVRVVQLKGAMSN